MGLTSDPNDPALTRGPDDKPVPQAETYLVMPEEKRKPEEYVRPVRRTYVHTICDMATTMSLDIAKTYAANPGFYGNTYCVGCKRHLPVDEFLWDGTNEKVGS